MNEQEKRVIDKFLGCLYYLFNDNMFGENREEYVYNGIDELKKYLSEYGLNYSEIRTVWGMCREIEFDELKNVFLNLEIIDSVFYIYYSFKDLNKVYKYIDVLQTLKFTVDDNIDDDKENIAKYISLYSIDDLYSYKDMYYEDFIDDIKEILNKSIDNDVEI